MLAQTNPSKDDGWEYQKGRYPHEWRKVTDRKADPRTGVRKERKDPESEGQDARNREGRERPGLTLTEAKPSDRQEEDTGQQEEAGDDGEKQRAELGKSGV